MNKLTSWETLAAAAAILPLSLLVIPRLGTTNDGGGTTSPAEAKVIIGGPRTHCGWGGNASSIIADGCFTPVCPRAAAGRSAAGQFLEGSLGGLILAVTHSSQ